VPATGWRHACLADLVQGTVCKILDQCDTPLDILTRLLMKNGKC
jgi:hypothetical protein